MELIIFLLFLGVILVCKEHARLPVDDPRDEDDEYRRLHKMD